jgi:YidC/Oxa1 family membrane protein insertase
MSYLYTHFIYTPLYNGLVGLSDLLPFLDAGLIIILFTIIVKLVLFPISKKAVRTQAMMKLVEPELNAIKEKYKNDKQAQALQVMNFYKAKQINPFSSIFLLFIQLPIIFALYKIFYTGFSPVDTSILYSFITAPASINMVFIGLIDVASKSWIMALVAAVSQFFQIRYSMPVLPPKKDKPTFSEDFARNMQVQMKYIFPVMIFFISYHVAAALALYWTTSNIFMIGQEIVVRRQLTREGLRK